MMKNILYLVIWPSGHEEKFYVQDWAELSDLLWQYNKELGELPDLIYRKE